MYNLGMCYKNGRGVAQDNEEAVRWFTESAEKGNTNAKFVLGVLYQAGTRVEKNPNQAVEQNSLTLFLKASFKTPRNNKTLLCSIIVSDNDKVEDEAPARDDLSASESKYKRRRCDCGMSGHVSVKECDLCFKTRKKLEFH